MPLSEDALHLCDRCCDSRCPDFPDDRASPLALGRWCINRGKTNWPDASFESAAGAAVTVREDDESMFKSTLEI
jgi:hypothetical protein